MSRNSIIVSTQSPPIAMRPSSAASWPLSSALGALSSASEIGWAKGRAISAAAVEIQKSVAKEVPTTRPGSSPSL